MSEAKLGPEQREAASKIGMLTLHGGIKMVPLDGQHRLKALEFAMNGKDQQGRDIPGIEVDMALANEDISVILVPYDPEKARRIFTRVNRYARRPTTSETYVTDDDDVFAVLARHVANRIGGRLVKYTQPSLTPKDREFTTLAILHACCKEIVKHSFPDSQGLKPDQLPESDIVEAYKQQVARVWDRLLSNIDVFRDATLNKSEDGDAKRREIRKENLLGKPVPQECLVSAYIGADRDTHQNALGRSVPPSQCLALDDHAGEYEQYLAERPLDRTSRPQGQDHHQEPPDSQSADSLHGGRNADRRTAESVAGRILGSLS